METYHLDELTLRLPSGFEDRSLQVFSSPPMRDGTTSFTVARERRSDASIAEQAEQILGKLAATLKGFKVVARRNGKLGALPSYEVRVEAMTTNLPIYQRIAFVGWYDTLLVITVTASQARRRQADALADRWHGSFRFRRREP